MKTFLICLLLLFTGIARAQILNIPDAALKNVLLSGYGNDAQGNSVYINTNGDNEIQVAEALAIYTLEIEALGPFTSIEGVEAFSNLRRFTCGANSLTDVSPVYQLTNLEVFHCSNNLLTTLDVSTLVNLTQLRCFNNQLTQLTFGSNSNLNNIECSENYFTTLDFSTLPALTTISFDTCPNLVWVSFKNGSTAPFTDFNPLNSSQIQYVCADRGEEDYIVQQFLAYSIIVNANTYCSFTPGGDYNTITGTLRFDGNSNGCDATDATQSFIKVKIDDGTNAGYTFTDANGDYTFYTQAGTFTVMPEFEDNQYFIALPAQVIFPAVDNSVATQDFCITADGIHSDVEVVMMPVIAARPGFDALYKIVYKNKGNQVQSGTVSCGWDASILYPVALTPYPDGMAPGTYSWNYSNLQPFENREILMTLNVNSPTQMPPVNSGDILLFTASVSTAYTDETPGDNYYEFNQRVVNSLDPNNIICIEGATETTDAIGDYLHYVVNFENTGTAPAEFVVITHDIDPAEFDINTVEVLNASNDVKARISGNRIEFALMNIHLGVADHGNILFKLKSRASLQEGDRVINQANIFFDYNSPLATNEATTVFGLLSTGNFTRDASVQVYPNPASNNVTVKADGNIQSVQLYDIQGRLLQTNIVNSSTSVLDISSRVGGMYFLKVTTNMGVTVEKIIKE